MWNERVKRIVRWDWHEGAVEKREPEGPIQGPNDDLTQTNLHTAYGRAMLDLGGEYQSRQLPCYQKYESPAGQSSEVPDRKPATLRARLQKHLRKSVKKADRILRYVERPHTHLRPYTDHNADV